MKIDCPCGGVISDTTDFLPYKARFFADQDSEDIQLEFKMSLQEEIEEIQPKDEEGWKRLVHRASVIFGGIHIGYGRPIYQCTTCGRLFVDDHHYESHIFLPEETPPNTRLLNSIKGEKYKGGITGIWYDIKRPLDKSSGRLSWYTNVESGWEQEFADWESLEKRYFEIFERLRQKDILGSALLKREGENVHFWYFYEEQD